MRKYRRAQTTILRWNASEQAYDGYLARSRRSQ